MQDTTLQLEIREAIQEDAAALLDFVAAMASDLNIQPGEFWVKSVAQEEEEIRLYRACENSALFVGLIDGVIVATCTMASRDLRVGQGRLAERHVVHAGLSVAKEWRAHGIGRKMLTHAIEWAKNTGIITRIEISSYSTSTGTRAFYKTLGFVEEGIKRNAIFRDGSYLDIHMLALLL